MLYMDGIGMDGWDGYQRPQIFNNVNIITTMLIIVLIFSLEEDSWKGIFHFPQCIEANNGQSP